MCGWDILSCASVYDNNLINNAYDVLIQVYKVTFWGENVGVDTIIEIVGGVYIH